MSYIYADLEAFDGIAPTPIRLNVDSWWSLSNPNGDNTRLANTAPVTFVKDLGSRGNDVSQSSGANQPPYELNSINGLSSIVCTGTQWLERANSASNNYVGPLGIFALVSIDAQSDSYRFISKSPTGGGWSSGHYQAREMLTTHGVTDYIVTTANITLSQFFVYGAIYNPTGGVDFYKNGVFVQNITGGAYTTSTGDLLLGAYDKVVSGWRGKISEVCLFFRLPTADEISQMNKFLMLRAGL